MKAQTPAEGILKKNDWGDTKMYHVVCDCGSDDHTQDLWIEAEDTGVTVTIYAIVKSPWWSMNRFQQIWKLLTQGYLEQQTVLTMDRQTALNYAETLKAAIKDVEEFRGQRVLKKETEKNLKEAHEQDRVKKS